MKRRQLAMCVLSATLFVQSTIAYGNEKEILTLTLEQAIESAQNTSLQLKKHERSTELAGENADMAKLTGGYYAYDPANVNYQYMKKQETVIRDNIELSITQLFDNIFYAEQQLQNLEANVVLQEKQILKSKIQYEKGLQSQFDLEGMQLKFVQTEQQVVKLREDIDTMYRQLENLTGKDMEDYNLEKPVLTFEPYREISNVKNFAESKAEDHIDLWKASEDLRVAEDTPIFTQDYMTYITKKADREDKADTFEQKQENLVEEIQDLYLQVKKLERDYQVKEADLVLKEKEQRINAVYLEQGMMSQVDYDLATLQYETAKLELAQLLNQHEYLKFKLDHPHVISTMGM